MTLFRAYSVFLSLALCAGLPAVGMATAPACYSNGDLICDTNPEGSEGFGCSDPISCGSADPIDNYMDYSDDTCMQKFTVEQVRRMRCTLQYYRPDVFTIVDIDGGIFSDGFETINQ